MSGGSWDYAYLRLEDIAEQLAASRNPLRVLLAPKVRLLAAAIHDIEWVDSGDYAADGDAEAIRAALEVNPIDLSELADRFRRAANVLSTKVT